MYTQCPECNAIFALTQEQLAACGGLVRCGQCAAVFRADERLFDTLPESVTPSPAAPARAPVMYGPRREDDPTIPTVTERPVRRISRFMWTFGSTLLLFVLVAQAAYFYRNELASYPQLRPWLQRACVYAGCELRAPQDVARVELLEAQVAPSQEYENVLSITASLVNHARYMQPFPLMEVSLLDSNGVTLARRIFTPQQYLDSARRADAGMVPNHTVAASLQITLPDKRAVGYEIQLVAP